ncbi:MAG TPA: alginate lyase family protein [Clostridia bacterium]|nr:alginate lyase family protein [Clostridia bacterium]
MTKSLISRREFCAAATAVAISLSTESAFAKFGVKQGEGVLDISEIDRGRVLKAATRYLTEPPITITAYSSPRSAGGKHDYFSEGDYWWPDPENPGGPYIQRDGMTNPDNFVAHRHALMQLSVRVPALTAAWLLTKDERYSAHAVRHLRAWFLASATSMNPNLKYAQAIHGRTTGRGIGIIDTLHLVEVARAIAVLAGSRSLAKTELDGVKEWFAEYLKWMTSSRNGQEERDAKNNHGTCWLMQVAEFARLTGNDELIGYCRNRFKTVIVPNQIAADGSFPQELRRTKPYGYCLFNLDAMASVCQILSRPDDNLWSFDLPDGRGMKKAMAFMFPYLKNKNAWPFAHDVMYWDDWPVRHSSLLFGGIALARPEYVELWRTLNPDPTLEEIVRNYPVRQPVLWFKPGYRAQV